VSISGRRLTTAPLRRAIYRLDVLLDPSEVCQIPYWMTIETATDGLQSLTQVGDSPGSEASVCKELQFLTSVDDDAPNRLSRDRPALIWPTRPAQPFVSKPIHVVVGPSRWAADDARGPKEA